MSNKDNPLGHDYAENYNKEKVDQYVEINQVFLFNSLHQHHDASI